MSLRLPAPTTTPPPPAPAPAGFTPPSRLSHVLEAGWRRAGAHAHAAEMDVAGIFSQRNPKHYKTQEPELFKPFQYVVPTDAIPGGPRQVNGPNGFVEITIPQNAGPGDTLQVVWQFKKFEVKLPKGYIKGTVVLKVNVPGGQVERQPPPEAVAGDTFDVYLQSPQVSIVERAAARKEMKVVIGDVSARTVAELRDVEYKKVDEPRPGALQVTNVGEKSRAHKTLYKGDLITKVNHVTNCGGTEGMLGELQSKRVAWVVTVLRDPRIVVT